MRIGVLYPDGGLMVMMEHGGKADAALEEARDLCEAENSKPHRPGDRVKVVSIDLELSDIVEINGEESGMIPQHVIALATVNARRARHGEARIPWERLECDRPLLESALNDATFVLEALEAEGLHVTSKVQR